MLSSLLFRWDGDTILETTQQRVAVPRQQVAPGLKPVLVVAMRTKVQQVEDWDETKRVTASIHRVNDLRRDLELGSTTFLPSNSYHGPAKGARSLTVLPKRLEANRPGPASKSDS